MASTWTAYARQKTTCHASNLDDYECQEPVYDIMEGEVIVRLRESSGPTVNFHPGCWAWAAVAMVKATPYLPIGKGRRKLDITEAQSDYRKKLLARHSAFGSRIRRYGERMDDGDPGSKDLGLSVQIMGLKQDEIWYEIKEYGGPPEKWRIPAGYVPQEPN